MLTILKTISEHDNINILLLANKLNIPRRSILRDIKKLKDLDIIAYTGSRKTGKYIFTDHGNKIIQELLKDI